MNSAQSYMVDKELYILRMNNVIICSEYTMTVTIYLSKYCILRRLG